MLPNHHGAPAPSRRCCTRSNGGARTPAREWREGSASASAPHECLSTRAWPLSNSKYHCTSSLFIKEARSFDFLAQFASHYSHRIARHPERWKLDLGWSRARRRRMWTRRDARMGMVRPSRALSRRRPANPELLSFITWLESWASHIGQMDSWPWPGRGRSALRLQYLHRHNYWASGKKDAVTVAL